MILRGILIALSLAVSSLAAPAPTPSAVLRVGLDDNYPPYIFRNAEGDLQGILPDTWRLWEKATGIRVELVAGDWDDILRRMRDGEFDVIDTVFKTEARMLWLDFSQPYARLEVPIFYDAEISGIRNAASLRGFAVATKRGDAAVELLTRQGVEQILLFHNYEDVVRAARDGKVNVFVVDQPPALYFLHRFGIRHRFKQTPPINIGEFHRGVRKGNTALLRRIEEGFARIPPRDLRHAEAAWQGSFLHEPPRLIPLVLGVGALILILFLGLIVSNRLLRRAVAQRTAALTVANEQLRLSNEQFQSLFDNAAVGILVADAQTRTFILANPRIENMLGYAPGELIGRTVEDIHPPEALPQVLADFEAQLRNEKILAAGHPCRRRDGRIFYVDICAGRLFFQGRICSLGLFTDVTQRKQAEEALTAKTEEMDRFVYTASHDLKAPLITFQTYLAFLEQDRTAGDEAAVRRDLDFLRSAAARMKSLLEDLLTLSRVGRVVHPPETIPVRELCDEALRAVAGALATRGVEIVWNLPDLALHGDRVRLVEIWQNLIDNAVKYMGPQEHPRIVLGAEGIPPHVQFFVHDNGIGIDPAHHQRIFELFTRLDSTREGTGMGLALVQRIVDLHHGRIWVESAGPGHGARFVFTLPDALTPPTCK